MPPQSKVKVCLTILVAMLALSGPASAVTISSVDLANFTAGGAYGPAAPASFTEPGPITVSSGDPTSLFAGPNYGTVDSLLLVISGAIPSGDVITLNYDGLAPITFTSADFVSTAAAGFPSNIGGIANGNVNGIVFAAALHAGADITGLPSGLATGDLLADVTISQTIATALRVDVFGDLKGTIINNAANSGALGVTGSGGGGTAVAAAVPEPVSFVLLGTGLLALALMMRRRRHG